jgi:hypothetical protein
MDKDLAIRVRAAYSATVKRQSGAAAFELAVEMVLRRWPGLTVEEARREVALMLSVEPDSVA